MTDHPGTALAELARMTAQARAAREALDAMAASLDTLEAIIHRGLEAPFEGVFTALPTGALRRTGRGKIEADPELQAFITARVTTMTFPELAAAVAARFPPERRVSTSSIHRWWHRRGKAAASLNRLSAAVIM